jgi:hypothetical protein
VEKGVWDGGGAHPNEYLEAHTIDLVTGKVVPGALAVADQPLKFGDVLELSEPARRKAFDALWVGKLRAGLDVSRLPALDADDAATRESCIDDIKSEDFLSGGGSTYELYLVEGGLAVHPVGWPNVSAWCFMQFSKLPVVLTPAELKPFLTPGQSLI